MGWIVEVKNTLPSRFAQPSLLFLLLLARNATSVPRREQQHRRSWKSDIVGSSEVDDAKWNRTIEERGERERERRAEDESLRAELSLPIVAR